MIDVITEIKNLKANKYYLLKKPHAIFTNNIYKINYQGLNKVSFGDLELESYHSEYFENFWMNYKNKLVFASGIYNILTKRLLIYYLEPWTRFTKKGELDLEMVKRMSYSFNLDISNKVFKIKKQLSFNDFLII